MQTQYYAFVPLEPIPCPRPRIMSRGKFAHAYYPASYKKWRAEFVAQLPPVERQFTRACTVDVDFRIAKARTSKLDTPKGDIDNYQKSLLDALTDHGLWVDDKQVVDIRARKMFATEEWPPGICLLVTEGTWLPTKPAPRPLP